MFAALLTIGGILVILGIIGLIGRFVGAFAPALLIIGIILLVIWYFPPVIAPGAAGAGATPTAIPTISVPTVTIPTAPPAL